MCFGCVNLVDRGVVVVTLTLCIESSTQIEIRHRFFPIPAPDVLLHFDLLNSMNSIKTFVKFEYVLA